MRRQSYDPQDWKDEPELSELEGPFDNDVDEEPTHDDSREEMIMDRGIDADNYGWN